MRLRDVTEEVDKGPRSKSGRCRGRRGKYSPPGFFCVWMKTTHHNLPTVRVACHSMGLPICD